MRAPPFLMFALAACATPLRSADTTAALSLDAPSHPLARGEREVRLSASAGLAGALPTIRINERDGQVSGEVIVAAPSFMADPGDRAAIQRDSMSVQYRRVLGARYGCETWLPPRQRDGDWLCRASFARGEPDWRVVLARLDSLVESPQPIEPPQARAVAFDSSGLPADRITACTDGAGWTVQIWEAGGRRVIQPPESLPGCGQFTTEGKVYAAVGWDILDEVLRAADTTVRR